MEKSIFKIREPILNLRHLGPRIPNHFLESLDGKINFQNKETHFKTYNSQVHRILNHFFKYLGEIIYF